MYSKCRQAYCKGSNIKNNWRKINRFIQWKCYKCINVHRNVYTNTYYKIEILILIYNKCGRFNDFDYTPITYTIIHRWEA